MKHIRKRLWSILLTLALLFALVPGLSGTAQAVSNIGGDRIAVFDSDSGTLSSDMTCSSFDVFDSGTLTISQGVTLTLNCSDYMFELMDNSKLELHGILTGSVSNGEWSWNSYINVYLSDGAKYTVTGLSCSDGDNYLRYYGYDAATDGNGTVSVKNGDADVTSSSVGYKTTSYTFTATPNSGYKFKNWTKGPGGEVLGTDASINVTCEQNGQYQVYANFEQAAVSVTGVSLNKTSTTLTVGATETLTATVLPDNAADKTVAWASKNPDIARVSEGVVTAVAPGTANITVTTTDGNKQATCVVTVNNPTISVNPSVFKGAYDGSAHGVTVNVTTPASGATVKYGTASDTCTLDASPTITNVAESPLTVYYRVTAEGYSEYLGWATVEISPADQTAPAAPTAASVSTNSITLNTIPNGEYKCGDGEWQTSPTFTGLTMNTSYTFYQRLAADANHNPSPASSAASISTLNHVHNWSYEAHGATITATCANTDGGHDGETTATLTINAPALTTYGGTGSAEATLTGLDAFNTATGLAVSATDIKYYNVVKIEIDGSTFERLDTENPLNAAPTDAGKYGAGITLEAEESTRAFVWYTIAKADIAPDVSLDGWIYGQTANTPSVSGNTDTAAVTYTYAIKGSTDFSATVPTNAGEYTVKAKVDATNNYNGGEATADFTIAKATVTVTADAKSKTYGDATDPTLTYTCSDLVSGDSFTGALTRASGENAGTYAITQGSLTAGDNYTISFTGANFTINKAAITITADDKSSKYGEDIAELTHTVGGAYKSGDELNVTLNTAASPTANVGEYEITVAYNNANYDATLVKGKYTITKTGLTVTAAGYTGSYDGNPHGITVDVGSSGATVYFAATELTAENYAKAGSTTAPTYTEAGENTVYFYVVSGNYDPDVVSGSKTVIITRATGTATDVQKPTAKTDLVADNSDQALVTAPAALPEGYTKVQYSLDGETWTDTVPTGKDAGSYTVNYKYVGDKNHNDFQGEPFTVTIKTLTVTFEVSGGSAVAAQSVVKGEKVTRPADPTKAGNAFDGWFQDATFSVAFDFETPITSDVTLYAKWTPNDYTLTAITGTTSDANHVWYKDSNVNIVLTVKLATEPDNSFAHYVRTEIDGTPVAATAREGSTVVTLAPADLQRLSVGAHTVSIVFDNGRVDTRLTVRQPSKTPSTGDQSHTALYLTVLAVSALGMAVLTGETKKRRSAKH